MLVVPLQEVGVDPIRLIFKDVHLPFREKRLTFTLRKVTYMVIVSRYFFYRNYVALTLWPFIILKAPELSRDKVLINHERIHLRQQAELLILPFYLWYLLEWIVRTIWHLNPYKAYRNLSFEREAYRYESDPNYLQRRKRFAFAHYLWKSQPEHS